MLQAAVGAGARSITKRNIANRVMFDGVAPSMLSSVTFTPQARSSAKYTSASHTSPSEEHPELLLQR